MRIQNSVTAFFIVLGAVLAFPSSLWADPQIYEKELSNCDRPEPFDVALVSTFSKDVSCKDVNGNYVRFGWSAEYTLNYVEEKRIYVAFLTKEGKITERELTQKANKYVTFPADGYFYYSEIRLPICISKEEAIQRLTARVAKYLRQYKHQECK